LASKDAHKAYKHTVLTKIKMHLHYFLSCFDTVGLAMYPEKSFPIPEMTYYV